MADNWSDLVMDPSSGDHFVQVYQDEAFLAEAVAQYVEWVSSAAKPRS